MNRRNVIRSILYLGGLSTISFSGFNLFKLYGAPDVSILDTKQLLIASLANTIIPETETPGANSAKVDIYIIKMLKYCTIRSSLNNFIYGLNSLEHLCNNLYNKPFSVCSENQRIEMLNSVEKDNKQYEGIIGKIQNKIMGESFISLLKQYTVKGYCTSKIGATKGLVYNPLPGKYLGCIKLDTNQNSWATS